MRQEVISRMAQRIAAGKIWSHGGHGVRPLWLGRSGRWPGCGLLGGFGFGMEIRMLVGIVQIRIDRRWRRLIPVFLNELNERMPLLGVFHTPAQRRPVRRRHAVIRLS